MILKSVLFGIFICFAVTIIVYAFILAKESETNANGNLYLRSVNVQKIQFDAKSIPEIGTIMKCPLELDGFGILNNNYCDCTGSKEVSDESKTSACSWYMTPALPLYYCIPFASKSANYYNNLGVHVGRNSIGIYASRIQDGICDCNDCQDEMNDIH